MHRIVNRTASPYDLQSVGGSVRLPAHGEVTGEFDSGYLEVLRAGGMVEIEESGPSGLSGRYEALAGRPADRRWSDKRLQAEIEKLEAGNADVPQ